MGRLDPKADRKKKTFIIRKIIFEPGFKDYDRLIPALAEKIRSFADFNGCDRIVIEQAEPEKLKDVLMKAL